MKALEPIAYQILVDRDDKVLVVGRAHSTMRDPSPREADGVYSEVEIDPHGNGPYTPTVNQGRTIAPAHCFKRNLNRALVLSDLLT